MILAGRGGKGIIIPSVSTAISSENEKLYWTQIQKLKRQVSLYTVILSSLKFHKCFYDVMVTKEKTKRKFAFMKQLEKKKKCLAFLNLVSHFRS